MAKYKITNKKGESYLIESANELTESQLASYAEDPTQSLPQKAPEQSQEDVPEKSTPAWKAAAHGLSQGVTLGAGLPATSGVQALIGSATTGKPLGQMYKMFYDENKAEEDLLKQEHPIAYTSGEVASYMTPGGSAKLFQGAAKGAKVVKGAGAGAKIIRSGLSAGLGVGAVEGTKKLLSEGKPLEAMEEGLKAGGTGFVAGAALASLGPIAKQYISWATKTPYKALEEYATNPATRKMLQEVAGKDPQIAEEIAAKVAQMRAMKIPEWEQAMTALSKIKRVPIKGVKGVINSSVTQGAAAPSEEASINMLQKWADEYIPKYVGKNTTYISGKQAEPLKRALQGEIDYSKLELPKYEEVMKKAAATLRYDIQRMATKSPETAEYVTKMDVVAKKLGALNDVKKALGNIPAKWEQKALTLLKKAQVQNGKSNYEMSLLENFDKSFGTNFFDKAKILNLSKQLGGAKPAIFPRWQTGGIVGPLVAAASMVGQLGLGLTGSGIAATASSSPRLWAAAIGARHGIEKGVGKVAASKWGQIANKKVNLPKLNLSQIANQRGSVQLPGGTTGDNPLVRKVKIVSDRRDFDAHVHAPADIRQSDFREGLFEVIHVKKYHPDGIYKSSSTASKGDVIKVNLNKPGEELTVYSRKTLEGSPGPKWYPLSSDRTESIKDVVLKPLDDVSVEKFRSGYSSDFPKDGIQTPYRSKSLQELSRKITVKSNIDDASKEYLLGETDEALKKLDRLKSAKTINSWDHNHQSEKLRTLRDILRGDFTNDAYGYDEQKFKILKYLKAPLIEMPKHINDRDEAVKIIAKWRLQQGK
jgi:hypothetical protein